MPEVPEHYYLQMSESIQMVFDLTSRIDERVKVLIERHNEVNSRIERLGARQEDLLTRISVLEKASNQADLEKMEREIKDLGSRLTILESNTSRIENKWKMIGDFVFKIAVALISGLALWKMGVNP